MTHARAIILIGLGVLLTSFSSATDAAQALPPERINGKGAEVVKRHFTLTAGATTFETIAGHNATCTAAAGTGEVTSVIGVTIAIGFTGCKALGLECKSTGAKKAGEIEFSLLGAIDYTNKSTKEVGQVLLLEKEVTVECSTIEKLKLRGSGIGVVPVNVLSSTSTMTFSQTKGVAKPFEYENAKGEKIKIAFEIKGEGSLPFAFEQSGLASTYTLTFEEAVEVKA